MSKNSGSEDLSSSNQSIDSKTSTFESAAIVTGAQVALASLSWIVATNSSTAINEGGIKAINKVRWPMFINGLPPMMIYNLLPVELAMLAQKAVGHGEEQSKFRMAASIFSGAITEAAIGNPLDFLSLSQLLHSFKITQHIQNNPDSLKKFSHSELLKFIPKISESITEEDLRNQIKANRCEKVSFTPQNLKIFSEKLNVRLNSCDAARAIAVMFAPSTFRNIPFYFGLSEANSAKKNESAAEETAAIAVVGALATTIPNNATYAAAANVVKGQEPIEALLDALKSSGEQALKDPKRFLVLAGIRSIATLTAITIFSDLTRKQFYNIIDGIGQSVTADLGIKTEPLTPEEIKKIDAKLAQTMQNQAAQESFLKRFREIDFSDAAPEPQPSKAQQEPLAPSTKSAGKDAK